MNIRIKHYISQAFFSQLVSAVYFGAISILACHTWYVSLSYARIVDPRV